MPKFDYIIQNPPYNKNLHIQFFNKGLDILSDTGKMTIIEPATWLMNLRQNSPNVNKLFSPLKERVKGRIEKIVIENLNGEFGTQNTTPFSITTINNLVNSDIFEQHLFGKKQFNKIEVCHHVNEIINDIFKKIINYEHIDRHVTSKSITNSYYIPYQSILTSPYWDYLTRYNYSDKRRFKNISLGSYHMSYISPTMSFTDFDRIFENIPKKFARGGSTTNRVRTNSPCECVYGSYEEMTNYRHYVLNNTLPLFINICMTINQNNNSLKYVPWLVDKQYTDQEIYEMFHFTEQEINLIEKTIRKYERSSPFFKRAMCGPKSVSDQEVQKFCDELDKEFPTE